MSISKGSERVKAWIYAVINPWSEAMEIENQLLEGGNTTFRWSSQKLEYIRLVAEHLAGRSARMILDDLVRGEPGLREFVQVHDDPVRNLEKVAQAAHLHLVSDDAFQDSIRLMMKTEPSVLPKMEASELVKWCAQRVINSGNDISERWEDYPFWKRHQTSLLTYRDVIPEVATGVDALHQKNEWLIRQLAEVRNKLVEDHDVPPAFVA